MLKTQEILWRMNLRSIIVHIESKDKAKKWIQVETDHLASSWVNKTLIAVWQGLHKENKEYICNKTYLITIWVYFTQ